MWSAGQGDNQERFLADLRALRDAAAIGYDELAARAHYPSNILKEAENGPGLPGLPILAAYVRACDADVPEWEERWRRLAHEAQTDPGLPVRPAGASPAAVAGARAGVTVVPPDAYDPERIRAALRGGTTDQAARDTGAARTAASGFGVRKDPGLGQPGPVTPDGPADWNSRAAGWGDGGTAGWSGSAGLGSVWGAGTGRDSGAGRDAGSGFPAEPRWDTTPSWGTAVSQDAVPTNGNHNATYAGSVFDTAVAEAFGPDVASVTQDDPAPTSWLADGDMTAPPEADRLWPGREDTEPVRWSADGQLAPTATAESEPGSVQDAGAAGAVGSAGALGTIGSAGVGGAAGAAESAGAAGADGSAVSQAAARPVRPAVATPAPVQPRRDRFFPLRLIAVMVVAAIVGSVLVLLIR